MIVWAPFLNKVMDKQTWRTTMVNYGVQSREDPEVGVYLYLKYNIRVQVN